jgi:hypothetical protein
MAVDIVTLELTGDVSLDDLSHAVWHLRGLLTELAREVAEDAEIVWIVEALESGSALAAVRGLPVNEQRMQDVEDVVRAYGKVGTAMQSGAHIGYSTAVTREAHALTSVLSGRIETIRFETPETEATVIAPPGADMSRIPLPDKVAGYGAVEGRVQTLTSRGGLRFTLYDILNDRAVSCYFGETFDREVMRGVWGSRAVVEGWVTRDAQTGRPLAIRRVTDVVPRPEGGRDDYMRARGAMAGAWSDVPPEQVIRRLRDA